MTIGVYWIYQVSEDRPVYVGGTQNIEKRFRTHAYHLKRGDHANPYLQNIWNKYGPIDFVFDILEATTEDNLIECETRWMDTVNPLCNIQLHPGRGMKGIRMKEETKRKLSLANTGRKHTEESKRKISESNKGHPHWRNGREGIPHSDEVKKRISESNKGKHSKPQSEESNRKRAEWSRNRKHTPETIAKLRIIKSNTSDETRKKLSNALRGRTFSPEHLEKLRQAALRNSTKGINENNSS